MASISKPAARVPALHTLQIKAAAMRSMAGGTMDLVLRAELLTLAGRYDRLAHYADECRSMAHTRRDATLRVSAELG
jgi:hypothetical protein